MSNQIQAVNYATKMLGVCKGKTAAHSIPVPADRLALLCQAVVDAAPAGKGKIQLGDETPAARTAAPKPPKTPAGKGKKAA